MQNKDDVVVSGLGVVSPIGVGLNAFNESLLQRKSGIRNREVYADTKWPFRIGGIVEDFEPKQHIKPRKSMKLMCREIQFGFGAAQLAIADAGLDFESTDSTRVGVVCGSDTFYCDPSSIADSYWLEGKTITDVSEWIERAMKTIEPLWMLKYLPNMIASHIAISIDAQGPNNSIIQGDASGLLALIEAADVIRRGWADVMICGGTGSKINPTYLAYHGIDDLAEPGDDPATACRPFDRDRRGTVGGEGAGMIVLERRSHAESRGADLYGALRAFDYGHARPNRDSQVGLLVRKIQGVMQKAGISSEQVSHVNSDASGEKENDRIVAEAIDGSLGNVGVTAYKGNFGNLGPAGATIETCALLSSLKTNRIPATINCDSIAPDCPVRVLTENVEAEQQFAIKLSHSDTGQQVAALFESEQSSAV